MTFSSTNIKFIGPKQKSQVIRVVRKMFVTEDNLHEIRGLISAEQHEKINPGDIISVILFYNNCNGTHGVVTIWHNKFTAAIKVMENDLFGEWDEKNKVVITEEKEMSWTIHGEELSGRIAFDIYGFEGIFSCGRFFRSSTTHSYHPLKTPEWKKIN